MLLKPPYHTTDNHRTHLHSRSTITKTNSPHSNHTACYSTPNTWYSNRLYPVLATTILPTSNTTQPTTLSIVDYFSFGLPPTMLTSMQFNSLLCTHAYSSSFIHRDFTVQETCVSPVTRSNAAVSTNRIPNGLHDTALDCRRLVKQGCGSSICSKLVYFTSRVAQCR